MKKSLILLSGFNPDYLQNKNIKINYKINLFLLSMNYILTLLSILFLCYKYISIINNLALLLFIFNIVILIYLIQLLYHFNNRIKFNISVIINAWYILTISFISAFFISLSINNLFNFNNEISNFFIDDVKKTIKHRVFYITTSLMFILYLFPIYYKQRILIKFKLIDKNIYEDWKKEQEQYFNEEYKKIIRKKIEKYIDIEIDKKYRLYYLIRDIKNNEYSNKFLSRDENVNIKGKNDDFIKYLNENAK